MWNIGHKREAGKSEKRDSLTKPVLRKKTK